MTALSTTRAPALAGLAAAILAIGAGTAISRERDPTSAPSRTAVLAGADATPAALGAATADAERTGGTVVVRRTGGLLEAEAQAAALAAQGYDVVIPAGGQARTAIGQAAASELPGAADW